MLDIKKFKLEYQTAIRKTAAEFSKQVHAEIQKTGEQLREYVEFKCIDMAMGTWWFKDFPQAKCIDPIDGDEYSVGLDDLISDKSYYREEVQDKDILPILDHLAELFELLVENQYLQEKTFYFA